MLTKCDYDHMATSPAQSTGKQIGEFLGERIGDHERGFVYDYNLVIKRVDAYTGEEIFTTYSFAGIPNGGIRMSSVSYGNQSPFKRDQNVSQTLTKLRDILNTEHKLES